MLKTLFIFDIDGTLVHCRGVGKRMLERAYYQVYGISDALENISLAGNTDSAIHEAITKKHRLQNQWQQLRDCYLKHLEKALKTKPPQLLPGVIDCLESLSLMPDVGLALLTGNYQRAAHLKLFHHGLEDFFEYGAFADDAIARDDLPEVLFERIACDHTLPDRRRIWIVGDSVRDVMCAKANDLQSIAVLTGFSSEKKLQQAQPTHLIPDLRALDFGDLIV